MTTRLAGLGALRPGRDAGTQIGQQPGMPRFQPLGRLPRRRFIRVPAEASGQSDGAVVPPALPIPLVAKKDDPEAVFALVRRRDRTPGA